MSVENMRLKTGGPECSYVPYVGRYLRGERGGFWGSCVVLCILGLVSFRVRVQDNGFGGGQIFALLPLFTSHT